MGNRDTRSYPTVKVGDFGLAEITYTGDEMNPQEYGLGTQDLMAPVRRLARGKVHLLTSSNRSKMICHSNSRSGGHPTDRSHGYL